MKRPFIHGAASLCLYALVAGQAHAADPFLKNLESTLR